MSRIGIQPSYLLQVGTRWYFRYAFPKKYCTFVSGEIRLSLKTGKIKAARQLAAYSPLRQEKVINRSGDGMTITKQEIRVPIHPFVADDLNLTGFVEHLKQKGKTRLFPELPYQNNNYGHKATKWFGRFQKSISQFPAHPD